MDNFKITRLKQVQVNVDPIKILPNFASAWKNPFNVKGLGEPEKSSTDGFDTLWNTFNEAGQDHLDDIYGANLDRLADKVKVQQECLDDNFSKIKSVLFEDDGEQLEDEIEDEEMEIPDDEMEFAVASTSKQFTEPALENPTLHDENEESYDALEETFDMQNESILEHEQTFDMTIDHEQTLDMTIGHEQTVDMLDILDESILDHEQSMLGLDETLTEDQDQSMVGFDDSFSKLENCDVNNESFNSPSKDIEKNLGDILGVVDKNVEEQEDIDQLAAIVLKKKLGLTNLNIVSEKENDIEDNSLMMTLPPEVLIIIMTNLNPKDLCSVSLVNKRMKTLACDPSLWKKVSFGANGDAQDDFTMEVSETKLSSDGWRAFSKCPRFKMVTTINVKLSQLRIFKTQQRMTILKGILKFNNLKTLKMYNDEVNADKSFANIPLDLFAKEIVNIESLDLTKANIIPAQVNAVLAPGSKTLKDFNISGNNLQDVDKEVLKTIVHLEKVNLSQTNLTPHQIYDILTEVFDHQKTVSIKELNFSGNDLLDIPPDLLAALVLKVKLNLTNTNLTSDQITKILEKVMNYPGTSLLTGSEIFNIIGENDLKGVPLYLLYELRKLVENDVGKIEKVLKTRTIKPKSKSRPKKKGKGKAKVKTLGSVEGKKEYLVRWMYWPEEFDTWIPAEFVYTKICNTAGKFQCNYCPKTYVSNAILRKHVLKLHEGAPLPENQIYCEICGKRFSRRATYTKHIKVHDGNVFQCNECPMVCQSTSELKTHQKNHVKNNTKSENCDVCGKVFKSKKSMYQHKSVHLTADAGKLEDQ